MNTFMDRGIAPLGYSMLRSALSRQQGAGALPTGGIEGQASGAAGGPGGAMPFGPGGMMGLLARMFRPGMGGVGAPLSLQPPGGQPGGPPPLHVDPVMGGGGGRGAGVPMPMAKPLAKNPVTMIQGMQGGQMGLMPMGPRGPRFNQFQPTETIY